MLFDRHQVKDALAALAAELVERRVEARIRVVGGAAVLLQVGREALTADIDALYSSSVQVRDAADAIARRRGWPLSWLSDAVAMYMTHFDTDDDWDTEIDERGVRILVARPPLLLAMKLLAGRGRRDAPDIDGLLDACAITAIQQAEELFNRYFPQEEIAGPARKQLEARFGGVADEM